MAQRRQASRKRPKASAEPAVSKWAQTWLDEAAALVCLMSALFLLLSFLSESLIERAGITAYGQGIAEGRNNLMGPVGHFIGTLLFGFMGWGGLVPVLCLAWLAVFLWQLDSEKPRKFNLTLRGVIGFLGILAFACALVSVFWGSHGGGEIGVTISHPLIRFFNRIGASFICGAVLLLSIVMGTGVSALEVFRRVALFLYYAICLLGALPLMALRAGAAGLKMFAAVVRRLIPSWRERFAHKPTELEEVLPKPRRRKNSLDEDDARLEKPRRLESAIEAPRLPEPEDQDEYTHVVVKRRTPPSGASEREFSKRLTKAKEDAQTAGTWANAYPNYKLPELSLLTKGEPSPGGEDDAELREKSRQIENKLRDFGILGKVTQVHPGPVITLFEFEPAPGIKVGRIASLQDDLAMTLRASSIRIIAPIPRRGTVGIEVPNRHRDIVRLRDVLESDAFVNSDSFLNVCIGKDTYGEPVVAEISTMPHLLMAGATGTGKSVCINAVLLSLLYRASPAELGLILIDPKILELSVYEDIPHLRVPVVTNPRQAKAVLQWAADEMNRRYRMMQRHGVRNIDGYNRVVAGIQEPEPGKKPTLDDKVVVLKEEAVIEEGILEKPDAGEDLNENGQFTESLEPLAKIVIVIDELADLMLSVGRDIEELITKLAQKARAAGIHLIVATQRPSVDVITGLIKANFPARLSFRVASRIDSRTILDSMGADKLLGRGDMLFMLPGAESLRRVHGAFVSDSEVKRVVSAVKANGAPRYDERIMRICERALEEEAQASADGGGPGAGGEFGEYDSMYDKAVELVVEKGHASTSMIQRVFRIGYNRAARIIEMMERDGVVGPMDGAKPREVLVNRLAEPEGGV